MEWSRHGDVLAGRYRLRDLLSEKRHGRFWRADDEVLGRPVAIHVLAAHDERAAMLMDAARASASVADHRLLRVLDAETTDEIAFVVNEWGYGTSLDNLLAAEGPLTPRHAARMTAEVAETITAAHALGYAHGRLNPENVLIDALGGVRIIGFAVDAALHGLPPHRLDVDVEDLGGLLYAALTGRWAGVTESAMPEAPRSHDRLLRARQVRAGVPRLLDELCDRVLSDDQPGFTTAIEVQAGLAEFIGDPLDLPAPPGLGIDDHGATVATPVSETPEKPLGAPVPGTMSGAVSRAVTGGLAEEAVTGAATGSMAPVDPEATMPGLPVFDAEPDTGPVTERSDLATPLGRRGAASPPPPPPEAIPPKPLFADEAAKAAQLAPEPAARTASSWADTGSQAQVHTGPGHPHHTRPPAAWAGVPDPTAEHEDDRHPGRNWLRLAIGIAVAGALVICAVLAYNLGRGRTPLGGEPDTAEEATTAPSAPATPLRGVTAQDFDPFGDPPQEYPDLVGLTVDGDPATAWRTSRYDDNFTSAQALKPGVGVVLDLRGRHTVEEVRLRLVGAPTTVQVLVTDQPPAGAPEQGAADGQQTLTGTEGRVRLDGTPQGRYVLVWLTELPAVAGGYRAEVAELSVIGSPA